MELLAHQEEIIAAIEGNFITSVAAPRQSGKTTAALAAVEKIGGATLFLSNDYGASRARFYDYEAYKPDGVIASRRSGQQSVQRNNGTVWFDAYTKRGAVGRRFDTIIFDDADFVDISLLEAYSPSLLGSARPRVAALSCVPDRKLAKHIDERADKHLRWHGLTPEQANPAVSLLNRDSLEGYKHLVPTDQYRREILGLADGEYDDLVRNGIALVIGAQLDGQVLA